MLESIIFVICFLSVINCTFIYKEEFDKSERLCANPPASCTCTISSNELDYYDDPNYIYSCFHNSPQDEIMFEMHFSENYDIYVECLNVSSFKIFPEFKNELNSTGIELKNCVVAINETLFELTSKISKDITNLAFYCKEPEIKQLNFTKQLFEGLPILESLKMNMIDSIVLNVDVFEKLVNLKQLNLFLTQTPNEIFDTLIQLEVLSIRLQNKAELKVGTFKNQRNLVKIILFCVSTTILDPEIFANLTNLEHLLIGGGCIITWPENMFKHNQKLKSYGVSFMKLQLPHKLLAPAKLKHISFSYCQLEEISEDFFKNSPNIEKIDLNHNYLRSLSKDFFVDQTMLLSLDLQFNKLIELVDELFDALVNMRTLLLSSNRLSSISRYVECF